MAELDYGHLSILVKRTQEGDSNAFAELYAATYKKQYRFAMQYLKDSYLAQDAIQEVYILVLKNIHRLNDSKLFVSWLNRITFRVCFDMHKKNFNPLNALLASDDISALDQEISSATNPEDSVASKDFTNYLYQLILDLPFSHSQAILLRYVSNLKLDAISEILDVSRSTTKRYIADGIKQLKLKLQDKEV